MRSAGIPPRPDPGAGFEQPVGCARILCGVGPTEQALVRDRGAPLQRRVADLLARMTLGEKLAQLVGVSTQRRDELTPTRVSLS